MAFQPASAHLQTRVVSTGPTTVAVVSQNFLKATARSKTSLTQIESLRASYPLKLMSPASTNTTPSRSPSAAASPTIPDAHANTGTTGTPTETTAQPLPPPPRIVYMITYGGGLLADDHPDLQFVLARHAKLLVLGQGNTKIYKSPRVDYPPASQTLHSTVGPGGVFLFLGPAVVACEDSSVFLRHEIVLQAQRKPRLHSAGTGAGAEVRDQMEGLTLAGGGQEKGEENLEEELPNCVVLDWIAGGRGEEERWKARRAEWRLVVRWADLEPESEATITATTGSDQPETQGKAEDDEDEEEFVEEEDPRDVADRAAGGPVIFRDGFLIEHNPPMPSSKSKTSSPSLSSPAGSAKPTSTPPTTNTTPKPTLAPKMTSYAPSLYPHSTIGSLFIMGPKTERLQQYILKRFEHITVYPGQKPELRPDYPVLWSATIIQIPRPSAASDTTFVPRRKRMMMKAMVVKMASQGIEQMQDFLKSLFEEHELQESKSNKLMDDSDHEEDDEEVARRMKKSSIHGLGTGNGVGGLSVIDQLFGGRATWERAFR
ncbi:hypothetical protein BGX30_004565 [Mortierella sp. GBA39]|nr:hypothetical protein BGX30_004565 [Mortierella sp. GBA39]